MSKENTNEALFDLMMKYSERTKRKNEEYLRHQLQSHKDKEDKLKEITPLELAIHFHNTYERLAPHFGYETREETRQFDNNSKNGMLMVAVCEVVLNKLLKILNEGDKETK